MKGALSYFECVARIATAISLGAVVMSPTRSVGRYATATDAPGELRFACLTLQGSLVESPEIEEHALSFWEKRTETRQDWSAFGAAKAFVDEVGAGDALTQQELLAAIGEGWVCPGGWELQARKAIAQLAKEGTVRIVQGRPPKYKLERASSDDAKASTSAARAPVAADDLEHDEDEDQDEDLAPDSDPSSDHDDDAPDSEPAPRPARKHTPKRAAKRAPRPR